MEVYEKYGLNKVINASGKMTILGVSKVRPSVFEAQQIGGENFFEIGISFDKDFYFGLL